ncbi:NADPH-dependent FMN reductase [Nitrosomonas sp.]|uniref:NADPH-dependent FMN reductase n=1 Tax=Nitrosomonas sp. TaxID=42353 RepID=UPI001D7C2652|nr:NADPH-dependent FMN reductase [Nitrosomonas sp.]MBX3616694.1 NAD(P)H-dependent oxidoreductase [Nitrosomonas sp.]
MVKILGISGSLRDRSYNTALLRAAREILNGDAVLDIATLHDIPLYNEDIESIEGIPQAVVALQEKLVLADGVLLATPEYNNSIPGVLKNAIDWLSRPPKEIPRIFRDRPIAVIGATMGGFGTVLSQNALLPVLRRLGMRPWFGEQMMVSKAHNVFDETGKITDAVINQQLEKFLTGYIHFIQANNRVKSI